MESVYQSLNSTKDERINFHYCALQEPQCARLKQHSSASSNEIRQSIICQKWNALSCCNEAQALWHFDSTVVRVAAE